MQSFLIGCIIVIMLSLPFESSSNPDEVIEDKIHSKNIKTVLFHKSGVETSYPILKMDKDERLTLKFDRLGSESQNFAYTIIHCTPDWKPSKISKSQYIDGMQTAYFGQYKNSVNTYKPYLHYSVQFPSRNMKPAMSGNYVLKVHEQGDSEAVVITKRFYVVEQKVGISGQVKRATYARYRNSKHELDFQVNYRQLNVSNPFREIKVHIRQNWRWDNMITDIKPSHVNNKQLVYDYQEENLFNAGNEYRRFDTRSVKYSKVGVQKVGLDSIFHAYLQLDEGRSYKSHVSREDINGQFYIRSERNSNYNTESDYVDVNFFLDTEHTLKKDEAIYVYGGLSNWKIQPRFRMYYLEDEGIYHTNALLKQGYYNYHYTVAEEGGQEGDVTKIEGSHDETENDYTLLVYFKDPFRGVYKLVGTQTMNSGVN